MQVKERKGPSDMELNKNFDQLLGEFNELWDSSPKDFEKFDLLKEKAKLKPLTSRQSDAIIARCNYAKNGTYGNTKKGIDFKAS